MTGMLQEWVGLQAERRPDAMALAFKDERVTYAALEEASNRLAHLLIGQGVAKGDRVCLLCPKSPAAVVGILGVLKANAIYVPLDTASPPARLERMIAACDTPWLLAGGATGPAIDALLHTPRIPHKLAVGWLGPAPAPSEVPVRFTLDDANGSATPPAGTMTPSDPAHILFTSGSTGVPKGVVVTHASVGRFIQWAVRYFGTAPTDRISGHPPLHFDLSTFDLFGTFAAGATLHLVPAELNLVPHQLAGLIRDEQLTQWFSVPSALNYMAKFDAVAPGDFPQLRRVLWCGEVLPAPVLRYWMERLPHVQFTNLYGPTEATIASSYYTVPAIPDAGDDIPIGRACDGEEMLVLDDALAPVPPGTLGHLYIRGAGLSPGYWRDAEKTRAAFLPFPGSSDPNDRIYRTGDLARMDHEGLVHFAGRADTQVKSRGYRVELGEIEAALHAVPGLRECAVLGVTTGDFDGVAICCAYVPVSEGAVTPAKLRAAAQQTLPPYMVPSRWMSLAEFPRTPSGKVDRRALGERFQPLAATA